VLEVGGACTLDFERAGGLCGNTAGGDRGAASLLSVALLALAIARRRR